MTRSLSSDGFSVSAASTDGTHVHGPSPAANLELERGKASECRRFGLIVALRPTGFKPRPHDAV